MFQYLVELGIDFGNIAGVIFGRNVVGFEPVATVVNEVRNFFADGLGTDSEIFLIGGEMFKDFNEAGEFEPAGKVGGLVDVLSFMDGTGERVKLVDRLFIHPIDFC